MLTVKELKDKLEDRQALVIAKQLKIPYRQVLGIQKGRIDDPKLSVVVALNKYFESVK
ncbi:MAG: hypothetical protein RIQ74_1104 [Pseudomonadota bacterium]|jgi:hypothetical protein